MSCVDNRKRSIYVLTGLCVLLFLSKSVQAGSFAYLIDPNGTVAIYDIDKNEVTNSAGLAGISHIPSLHTSVVADRSSNLLFIVEGRFKQRIKVFDLLTLQFKKDMGIVSQDPDYELPRVFAPSNYQKVIVRWWDKQKALTQATGETNLLFDKATMNETENDDGSLQDYDTLYFSGDGQKTYAVRLAMPYALNSYNTTTFALIESIPLSNLFNENSNSKACIDYANDMFLFDEIITLQNERKKNSILHVYDVKAKAKIKTIPLGFNGEAKLTPDGKKIIVEEDELVFSSDSMDVINEIRPTGVIHIYDIITGKQTGQISLLGSLRGIAPDSSKAFFVSNVTSKDGAVSQSLVTVDLNTYSITASVPVTKSSYMVFFNK